MLPVAGRGVCPQAQDDPSLAADIRHFSLLMARTACRISSITALQEMGIGSSTLGKARQTIVKSPKRPHHFLALWST